MVLQEQSWGTPGGTESADRVADVLLLFAQSDRAAGRQRDRPRPRPEQGRGAPDPAVPHGALAHLGRARRVHLHPRAGRHDAEHAGVGPAGPALPRRAGAAQAARRDPRDDHPVGARGPPADLPRPVREPAGGEDGRRARPPLPAALRRIEPGDPGPPAAGGHRAQHLPAPRAAVPTSTSAPTSTTSQAIRAKGYGASSNERGTGAASIASPFFDLAGNVLGSISSSGPVFRYGEEGHEDHARAVVTAARAISATITEHRR